MKALLPRETIYVNGRFLSHPVTGVERYAREVLNALDKLLTGGSPEPLAVTVLAPPNAFNIPAWNTLRMRQVGRLTGHLWEQLELPFYARHGLLFTPSGGAPVLHSRNVVMVHDAAPFRASGTYTAAYRTYYKTLIRFHARTAVHIVTNSEFSRQELIQYVHIPQEKITSVWLSGEHILRYETNESVLAKYQLSPHKYVLAVGSRSPNKNLHGLVQAFSGIATSDVQLVIAGGTNSKIFAPLDTLPGRMRELGFVTDEELRTLYHYAACFVFPSFYEGFGLPPLEALACGTPVIVSRAASLPEIFGEAATYCDPYSPDDIARQIEKVLLGHGPGREAGVKHAARFTWESCARRTWCILTNAIHAA